MISGTEPRRSGSLHFRSGVTALLLVALSSVAAPASARDIPVTPSTLRAALTGLVPGDRVVLASGTYEHFTLTGVVGTPAMPIVVEGPTDGSAIVAADTGPCCNTIQIDDDVSYVVIRGLTVDGGGVDGAFGVDARGADVHHVTIEGCTFLHHDASQQTVAISTKTPTSGWVIRGNRIMGAGTGMYLGNSDGTDPFVGGLIEGNLFYDTVGYNVQIKWQLPHAPVPGAADSPTSTIIRHNVFVKTDRASPDGDRPNLLVGGYPATGADSTGDYQIYGNVFAHNPRESLLQVSGRASIHDNVFFDAPGTAIRLVDHDLPLVRAWVYDNTISVSGTGISFGNAASEGSIVAGNLVLAGTPISGSAGDEHDNLTGAPTDAASTFVMPGASFGAVDYYPLAGAATGAAIDLSPFASDLDFDVDFNCIARAGTAFRGAYAGEGTNPGWAIALEPPPIGTACGTVAPQPDAGAAAEADAGADAGSSATDGGLRADGGAAMGATPAGCGCGVGTRPAPSGLFALLGLVLLGWQRRQSPTRRPRSRERGTFRTGANRCSRQSADGRTTPR